MNSIYLGTLCFLFSCYAALQLQYFYFGVTALIAAGLLAAGVFYFKRNSREKSLSCGVILFFLLLGLLSGLRAPTDAQKELEPYYGRQVTLHGKIDLLSVKQHQYGTSFLLECQHFEADNLQVPYRQYVRVFTAEKYKELPSGAAVCSGKLEELTSFRNPGGFDGALWNRLQGIGGSMRKAAVTWQKQESLLDKFAAWNIHLRQRISEIAGEKGALLAGMVLGGSAGLDEESRRLFADNGLSHLLSVSGSHLVVLTGFLLLLLSKVPRKMRNVIIGSCLLIYAALCGWKPPVVRALLMSLVLLYGGNGAAKGNILCVSAVVMLIFKPLWLLDTGFQLSFGAAAGLIWLLPRITQLLSSYLPLWLSEAVGVTIAAQLPVLPILISSFHQLPVISLLSNILLTPVLECCVLLTMAGLALDALCGWGSTLIIIAAYLLKQVLIQANFLSAIPGGQIVVGSLPSWSGVIYYFLLVIVLDLACVQFLHNKERRFLSMVLTAVLMIVVLWSRLLPQPLTAYFLDVGQGDSTVVVTPAGQVIVIDTGGLKNYDTGSRIVAPFLRSIGKDKVDVLLLSHGDFDHAGGAAGLAANINIDRLIVPPKLDKQILQPKLDKQILQQVQSHNPECRVEYPAEGQQYQLKDGGSLDIVSIGKAESDSNDAGIVAAIEYAGHKLLFPGDISSEREEQLQNIGNYEVLKVAHHGSSGSSSAEFLQQIQPAIAVISAGRNNSYGHPHQETLQRLQEAGAEVWRTDQSGAVKIVFDGAGTKCYSYVYHKRYF
jgi:competence protein ComEC